MRLREVVRFEVEHRLRRPSTWLSALLLAGVPFLLMHAVDGSDSHVNAPEKVALLSVLVGTLGMLVTAALMGDAATRDAQTGMDPLFAATPVRAAEYLGGRFLGALAVNAVLLLGVPLGMIAGAEMPYLDARMFGPLRPEAYAQAYVLFLLPNLLFSAAVLFTVAALARHALPAYLAGIALFAPNLEVTPSPDGSPLATALADPFGLVTLEELTRYWTPVELESRLVGFPPVLLWNRLLWIAVAAAVLVVLLRRYRFAHAGGGRRRWGRGRAAALPEARPATVAIPSAPRGFGPRTRLRQTLAVFRLALGEMVRSRAFPALLAGALVFTFAFGWDVGGEVFGTSTWPVTHLVAGTVLGEAVSLVVSVLIALFAGELVWRERDVRIGEIADSAPVPTRVLLLGRFLALAALLVVLQAVLAAAGMTLQALQGYHRFEPGLYLRILFGIKLVDYLLLAALALAVHVVVNQKYVGHMVVVLYFVFAAGHGPLFGIRHNLLVYGADPGWTYSDMNGFGPFPGPWAWFNLYWAAWALLLSVAAGLLWVRGRETGMRRRLAGARARLTGPAAGAAGAAALLVLTTGGFIFYNTNVLNDYRTPLEETAPLAEYERRYKRFEDAPQPAIAAAELRVEIHPDEGAAELAGAYRLVNRTAEAIDSVHVILPADLRIRALAVDGAAEPVLRDEELGYRIYRLRRPLAPGDSLRLRFDLEFRPRGFPNRGIPTQVVRNGAYFDRRWLPVVGYQPGLELDDARDRRMHGLPPRSGLPAADDPGARRYASGLRDSERVHVDAVVGTDDDQVVVTPGTLVREWTEDGRRYFHYRTESPLPFGSPFLSAGYDVREDRWRDVALRIFHHPTHTVNLDRMTRSMKASLGYFTREFGPYPFDELRIVEFPRYAAFARAHPHTIAFSEGSAFLTRVEEGDVDRTFFVVAHETAHQWWGGRLQPARARGGALLSETLAQYGAMMVMEEALGPEQVRRFYDYEMENYLRGRRAFSNREVPLLEVGDQPYLYYHKGAVVMYTLREHLGEARVNAALRRLLAEHGSGDPPYATSLDLYRELRAVTPDSLRPLLADLFERITLWDVRAERATAEPAGAGAWRVTLDVRAAELRADSVGAETEVPMDDLVEIGVFAPAEDGEERGGTLYLRRHRVRSGESTITVTVPRRPARAGIDPLGKLIQREPGDNTVDVAVRSPRRPTSGDGPARER